MKTTINKTVSKIIVSLILSILIIPVCSTKTTLAVPTATQKQTKNTIKATTQTNRYTYSLYKCIASYIDNRNDMYISILVNSYGEEYAIYSTIKEKVNSIYLCKVDNMNTVNIYDDEIINYYLLE